MNASAQVQAQIDAALALLKPGARYIPPRLEAATQAHTPEAVAPPKVEKKTPAPRAKAASPQTPSPIPAELRNRPQWVGWKSVENPGAKKPRKVPISPHTGGPGSSTDRATWSDYNTAVSAVARYSLAGVGFVFDVNDPFAGVDLDDCRNPETGEIAPWAKEIIAKSNSYSEVSPSMTGVKIFLRGKLPANAKHNTPYQTGSVEVYSEGRYFTTTGAHVPGTPTTIEDRQTELTAIYDRVFGAKAEQAAAAAGAVVGEPIEKGGRTPRMVSLAGTMTRRGMSPEAIESALLAENAAKCDPPLPEGKVKAIAHDIPRRYPNPGTGTPASATPPVSFSNFIEDPRPKIRLRGDNRLLSDVSSEVGPHLSAALYAHNGEVVEYRDGALHPVTAQRFRTLAERHVIFYRVRSANESNVRVGATLEESDARGILQSPQFLECLKPLSYLNSVRRPIFRADKSLDLLPEGYDAETATLTDVSVSYAEDTPFADALVTIRDLFGEFQFSDGERSRSVAISALLGLYAKQLLKPGELRPAFTYVKNAEGAGATTLAACVIIPVLGDLPIGCKAKDDDEMRKALTSANRTGQDVIFLDNMKGQLNSPALEAFVSAPVWRDRILGSNEMLTAPNNSTVIVTSNGLSVTPDWRRRSLFAELHLSEERAEDRAFARPLSAPVLKSMRPKILAACWALVRAWDAKGRPQPSRSHSAFPAWASIIGGIVEAAGFACPFTTANVAVVADEDGQNMRTLVAEMTPGTSYTSSELVDLCRKLNIFDGLVGDAEMGRAQRSAFGKLLARYHDRMVNDLKFFITGSGHAKRFFVRPTTEVRI